jgi:hypothetical protein
MKLWRTEHSFRKWSDCDRKLPAYINVYTTSFCHVRKCDSNDRTNDKQISIALAKIHKSRGDLVRVKTVNVVKNRWLPSLRSAATTLCSLSYNLLRWNCLWLVYIQFQYIIFVHGNSTIHISDFQSRVPR